MVRLADLITELEEAVIVVAPRVKAIARPLLPAVLLIVATLAAEELQVTNAVTFGVLPRS